MFQNVKPSFCGKSLASPIHASQNPTARSPHVSKIVLPCSFVPQVELANNSIQFDLGGVAFGSGAAIQSEFLTIKNATVRFNTAIANTAMGGVGAIALLSAY